MGKGKSAKNDYEETAAGCTAYLYNTHKRIRLWLSEWENIPGDVKIRLCSRVKLLFLPRRSRFLSHWGAAGSVEPARLPDSLRNAGVLLSGRQPFWAFSLRLAVPLRAGAGPPAQNPCFSQEKTIALAPYSEIWEIYGFALFCIHWLYFSVQRICEGSGILQIYLPLRHIVWRYSAAYRQQVLAQPGRETVLLETGDIILPPASIRKGLSSLLSISMPIRCYLWLVQPLQPGTGSLGKSSMYLLWSL